MEQNIRASQERYQITHAFKKVAARIAGGLEAPARAALESAIEHEADKRIRSRLLGALDKLDRIERSGGLPNNFGQAIVFLCTRAGITVSDLAREIEEIPSTLLVWTNTSRRGAPDKFTGFPIVQRIEKFFDLNPGVLWKLVRFRRAGAGTIPARFWPAKIPADERIRKAVRRRLPDHVLALDEGERHAMFMYHYKRATEIRQKRKNHDRAEQSKRPYRHNPGSWHAPLKAEIAELMQRHNMSIEEAGDDWPETHWSVGTQDRVENGLSRYLGVASLRGPAGANIPIKHLSLAWMAVTPVAEKTAKFAINQRSNKDEVQQDEYKFVKACKGLVALDGHVRNRPQLAARLVPIQGLITADECKQASADWDGFCDRAERKYERVLRWMSKRLGKGSNPKLPVVAILNSEKNFHDHYQQKVAEDAARYDWTSFGGAFRVRDFINTAIETELYSRSRTLRETTWRADNTGHLRKIGEKYYLVYPRGQYKNGNGPIFEDEAEITIELDDIPGLRAALDSYLDPDFGARRFLLDGKQSDMLFIINSEKTEHDADTAYASARRVSERVLAKEDGQPWEDVEYLGVHVNRQIGYTWTRKQTGSAKKAANALLITEPVGEKSYGFHPPSEKVRETKKIRSAKRLVRPR
jgi:hypothetical protein